MIVTAMIIMIIAMMITIMLILNSNVDTKRIDTNSKIGWFGWFGWLVS